MKRITCLLLILLVTLGTVSGFPVAAEGSDTYTVRVEVSQIWDVTPPQAYSTLQYTLTPESENYPKPTGGLSGGPSESYLFNVYSEYMTLLLQFPFTHPGLYCYTVQSYLPDPTPDYIAYSQNIYRLMINVTKNDNGELTVSTSDVHSFLFYNKDKATKGYKQVNSEYKVEDAITAETGHPYMIFGPHICNTR
ncbi:MAG: hypothetical protein J5744_08045 [Oscillospiraceae bacterium]|nr:hypothetical protein [Oscillospiraceae bacterium]